ncbi:Imm27 family immunity protein [Chelatococcus asaccharovorans]|uniref:Immunity protein 27 of polymorphic toxin system n=1 Tax=Chelatococcus asaccharovorans TaxID=28210 RepID=A0A2V3U1K5_9HYPH|nr:Imm27 family immunity protein [Chelatococcus asaccharovorans]MBS7702438.1 hypothetical protein [Chelatococcus asaccharovorans]PXW56357.1 immunity protein 27 of polymorphic toxin system [Chelatococcus asaccharovorans]
MTHVISPNETVIEATWDDTPEAREINKRINYLGYHYLKRISVFEQDWAVLLQDPEDGRFWEWTNPDGDRNGGGPPRLEYISTQAAAKKYNI